MTLSQTTQCVSYGDGSHKPCFIPSESGLCPLFMRRSNPALHSGEQVALSLNVQFSKGLPQILQVRINGFIKGMCLVRTGFSALFLW